MEHAAHHGPSPAFVPWPYPRRARSVCPAGLQGLVIDGDVERGAGVGRSLQPRRGRPAPRRRPGLEALPNGGDRFEVVVAHGDQVDHEDITALQSLAGGPAVVLIGAQSTAESLDVQALPEDPSEGDITTGIARALESRLLRRELALRDELDGRFSFGSVVTRDPALQSVLRTLESADTRARF